ncbi:hypothetical protein AAG747_09800 [Rapidithrix thailandica]|uniref:Uncharacterized protein n=1 Tax=Rapidithrix thailandica TaxID=413964 RepID=A0AAW9S709_9BACT
MPELLEKLQGGDLKSLGKVPEVIEEIGENQDKFDEVFDGIFTPDPVIRKRAATAVEKISQKHPDLLRPHKKLLLKHLPKIKQHEVKWNLAQTLPRLKMSRNERSYTIDILLYWLRTEMKSKNVMLHCMEALAQLAQNDLFLQKEVVLEIEFQSHSGNTAVKASAQKILKDMK